MPKADWHDWIAAERPNLLALAYRMTGSLAAAEDILQKAWWKCRDQAIGQIDHPLAFLRVSVARLSLDHLRAAKREAYVGPWLPEPLVSDLSPTPETAWMAGEKLGIGLQLMLERLTPQMRAGFVLVEAFDYSHDEVAQALGIQPAHSRQLLARARKRMAHPPEEAASPAQARRLAGAFWRASRDGDLAALMALLAPEVEVHTDGGGKVYAALKVIKGAEKSARLFLGLAQKRASHGSPLPKLRAINGHIGFLSCEEGVLQSTALSQDASGRVRAIWICRNPEKLGHLAGIAP